MKFEFWKTDEEWFFHIAGANGEIMGASEGYKNKKDCLSTIDTIKRGAFTSDDWKSKGQHWFHLKGGNGEIIAQSEGYTRRENCLLTLGKINAGAADAPIVYVTRSSPER
jgi:uncharacterized protein